MEESSINGSDLAMQNFHVHGARILGCAMDSRVFPVGSDPARQLPLQPISPSTFKSAPR